MRIEQARNDERDNKRAFRWGIGAAVTILLLAIVYNLMSHARNDGEPSGSQGMTQPAPSASSGTTGGAATGGGPAGNGGVTGNGGGGGQSQTGTQ